MELSFEAIGTHWQINIDKDKAGLKTDIKKFIDIFDENYSRFRKDSLVTKMSHKKGKYKLPGNAKKMIDYYKKLYNLTQGRVTPLIGRVMSDAGYDANYSLMPKKLTHPPKWEDVMDYNYPYLEIKKPVLLDFGAAGKGYLVDLVGEFLMRKGIDKYCIDAGGDILYKGTKLLKIGLEHPDIDSQVIGTVNLKNQSICGSAGNRRRWGKFNHIINPHTLKPVNKIKAVWVIAPSAMIADGLATALFFVNPEKLAKDFDFSYLIINEDLSFDKSKNFHGDIFIK